jgi:hypothetical protein
VPALKAATSNPEGTLTSVAAEAGPGGNVDEVGWMAEAVGPLVIAMGGKMWPLAWTSLQLTVSTMRLYDHRIYSKNCHGYVHQQKIPGEEMTGQLQLHRNSTAPDG